MVNYPTPIDPIDHYMCGILDEDSRGEPVEEERGDLEEPTTAGMMSDYLPASIPLVMGRESLSQLAKPVLIRGTLDQSAIALVLGEEKLDGITTLVRKHKSLNKLIWDLGIENLDESITPVLREDNFLNSPAPLSVSTEKLDGFVALGLGEDLDLNDTTVFLTFIIKNLNDSVAFVLRIENSKLDKPAAFSSLSTENLDESAALASKETFINPAILERDFPYTICQPFDKARQSFDTPESLFISGLTPSGGRRFFYRTDTPGYSQRVVSSFKCQLDQENQDLLELEKEFTSGIDNETILIYTAGYCFHNQGNSIPPYAGCAFLFGSHETRDTVKFSLENEGPFENEAPHSSNRAQLRAVIGALQYNWWTNHKVRELVIATHSDYVVSGACSQSLLKLARNGWLRDNRFSAQFPVENADLWRLFLMLIRYYKKFKLQVSFWHITEALNFKAFRAAHNAATPRRPNKKFSNLNREFIQAGLY